MAAGQLTSFLHRNLPPLPQWDQGFDLSQFGQDAYLKYNPRPNQPFQLRIHRAGTKTLSEMLEITAAVFDGHPEQHRILKVDLAADVPSIPMDWFTASARVPGKRKDRMIDEEGVTQYFGKGRDSMKIYDKLADIKKKMPELSKVPAVLTGRALAEMERLLAEHDTLVRVERTLIGSSARKQGLITMSELRHAGDIDAFAPLSLLPSCEINMRDVPSSKKFAVTHLRAMKAERGWAEVYRAIRKTYGRNAPRYLKHIAPYLGDDRTIRFNKQQLRELFRESTTKQMAA